ncbi:cytochrome c [Roseovarius sp. A21]|uniref:Cytochrome c n=1 Tax=Roseovarius bejariae TaxID=2576383 RepID=A0A844CZH2_9RHOB|nr:cytochrome c [Roseovarius bejariae]MRU15414.1 cytochrome c [Roseovarius bejariae]
MSKKLGLIAAIAALAGVGLFLWNGQNGGMQQAGKDNTPLPQGAALADVRVPDGLSQQAQMGERAFNGVCADCHGKKAAGRQGMGPPLVHKIYEPSHHGDMAFHLAVKNGVRAHHWPFGNMPSQSGLTKGDVSAIVAYVRELQRENGIE